MRKNTQFAPKCVGYSSIPVSQCYTAIEHEREQMMRVIAAFHKRLRFERQMRSMRNLATLWPVALGVLLGFYAPLLRDFISNSAPWALNLLFPFSAVAGQRGFNLSRDTAQSVAQFLVYAQFPLEGLLVRIVLKHRLSVFRVFSQVTCLHVFTLLYLGLATGALNQILGS
jgi:hypothetical protein